MFAKNTLVAAAALALSVAAQAQSNVTVYGNVDAAFGTFESDLTHRVTKVESSVLTGSFLGFKGQEDLGGGTKVFFKLENAIGVDTGATATGNFWGRTSEIGLAGAYGTVTAGNSLSLSGLANQAQSPFNLYGMLNGLQAVTGAAGFDWHQTNTLTYTSQTYAGFSGAAQYGTSETHGVDNQYAVQANYAVGPLAAGLTYTNNDSTNDKLTQLGGSYDFGVVKGFAQIGRADLASKNDVSYFGLGVSAPVTAAGTVLASWTHAKQDNVGKTDDLSVAYDHAMSKRTGAYGAVVYQQFKPQGGDSKSGLSLAVGLRHAF